MGDGVLMLTCGVLTFNAIEKVLGVHQSLNVFITKGNTTNIFCPQRKVSRSSLSSFWCTKEDGRFLAGESLVFLFCQGFFITQARAASFCWRVKCLVPPESHFLIKRYNLCTINDKSKDVRWLVVKLGNQSSFFFQKATVKCRRGACFYQEYKQTI